MLSETFLWKLLENYFETQGLVDHQISSYDDFINNGIERIVKEASFTAETSDTVYTYTFGEVYVPYPTITDEEKRTVKPLLPNEARIMDLMYDAPVFVDIHEMVEKEGFKPEIQVHKRVNICRVPIMLMSCRCHLFKMSSVDKIKAGECERDPGGYFIINGLERALVGQLRGIYNQPVVLKQKPSEKYKYICELRSMSEETGHSVQLQAKLGSDDRSLVFVLPYIKEHIPVGIVFKALGFLSENQIRELLRCDCIEGSEKYIQYIMRDSFFIKNQDDALKYIGQYPVRITKEEEKVSYAAQVVENELFPHMGVISTIKEKAILLGDMVNKMLRTNLGLRKPDDRDNYSNKRIEMSGVLCFELFRTLFKKFVKYTQLGIKKKKQRPDIVSILSRNTTITQGLRSAWSLGNWGVPKANYVRKGVSQVLQRLSYASFISHLRRVVIQSGKDGKNANAKIRQIHGSQIFTICPAESPEGASVGLVLNLALTCTVTKHIPCDVVKEIIRDCEYFIPIKEDVYITRDMKNILLNGMLVGLTDNPLLFIEELQQYRETGLLHRDISFIFNDLDNEVKIFCDEGRFIRPMYSLKNGKLRFSEEDFIDKEESVSVFFKGESVDSIDWEKACKEKKVVYKPIEFKDFLEKRYIEYIDTSETEGKVLAMQPKDLLGDRKYDFLELDPSMMLGAVASTIPFSDHIPGARTVFQSSMSKQGLGMFALSHNLRTDTESHVANYPQRALVDSKASNLIGYDEMLYGTNAIVAILSMANNQEDSIILNKSSVQRGMFRSTTYKTITVQENESGAHSYMTISFPPVDKRQRRYNYSLLDSDGIIKVGCSIQKDDVLVAKTLVKNNKNCMEEEEITDCSYAVKSGEEGVVDRVIVINTPNGYKLVKIIVRTERVPEVADKFAARAAQKGTIGLMLRQEDMPFTQDGIVPDLIINSHAIPSRMTVNILLEGVLGKTCLIKGKFGDGTPFGNNSTDIAEKLCEDLASVGFERTGAEIMYSGETGEEIPCKVFFAPIYYMRLKHLVSNKIHRYVFFIFLYFLTIIYSRSSGQVTSLTRQPLEGRSRSGGLRLGEVRINIVFSFSYSIYRWKRMF